MPSKEFRGKTFFTSYNETHLNKVTGSFSSSDSGPLWSWLSKRTNKSWVRTPNFTVLRKMKSLPMNGFTFSEEIMQSGTITRDWDSATDNYHRVDILRPLKLPPSLSSPHMPPDLLQKIKSNLISQAKGQQWNAPVFVAEAGKTAEMVTKSAKALVNIFLSLKKGRIDLALAHMRKTLDNSKAISRRFNKSYGTDPRKAAANAWLETKYGWIPFISDVRDATNTLMDVVDSASGRTGRITARARKVNSWSVNDVYEVSPPMTGETLYQTDLSARAVWHFIVPSQDLPGRFGLTNPALVAWELVPFSFVADWFVPIGDYLGGLDVSMRLDHKSGTFGYRASETTIAQVTDCSTYGYTSTASGSSLSRTGLSERTVMSSIPSLKLSDISFSAQIGPQRALSAIALLQQVFSNRR